MCLEIQMTILKKFRTNKVLVAKPKDGEGEVVDAFYWSFKNTCKSKAEIKHKATDNKKKTYPGT